MAFISTGGNQPIPTVKKKPENTEPDKIEPPRQKPTLNDDNDAPYVYCMECEDPSVGDDSKNYIPLDEESEEDSES